MRVLVFEDRPEAKRDMEKFITSRGHAQKMCSTCNEVKTALDSTEFDLYILDLNVPTEGLNDVEAIRTMGAQLTGWILLLIHIRQADPNVGKKTVIFSDFIDKFKNYIDAINTPDDEKTLYNTLSGRGAIIAKSEGYSALVSFLPKNPPPAPVPPTI